MSTTSHILFDLWSCRALALGPKMGNALWDRQDPLHNIDMREIFLESGQLRGLSSKRVTEKDRIRFCQCLEFAQEQLALVAMGRVLFSWPGTVSGLSRSDWDALKVWTLCNTHNIPFLLQADDTRDGDPIGHLYRFLWAHFPMSTMTRWPYGIYRSETASDGVHKYLVRSSVDPLVFWASVVTGRSS